MPADPEASHYYAQWAYVKRQDDICVRREQAALRAPGLNDLALLQMYTLLGMCQGRLEKVEDAKASFRKARAINLRRTSFDPTAAYEYVQLLARLGEFDDAIAIVDEILQRVPVFGPGRLERVKALEREGRPEAAIEGARSALVGDGNNADTERAAHGVLARCYFATGNVAAAAGAEMVAAAPESRYAAMNMKSVRCRRRLVSREARHPGSPSHKRPRRSKAITTSANGSKDCWFREA